MLTYSSAGSGSNLHAAVELLENLTATEMVHVPYKGGGPALTAVLGGEVALSILAVAAVRQQAQAGRIRALAITSTKRSPAAPEIPTVIETGVPGYEFSSWVGIVAPSATPAPIVAALGESIAKTMRAPGMNERFAADGTDVIASTPAEFAAFIKSELTRWAKVVRENRLRVE